MLSRVAILTAILVCFTTDAMAAEKQDDSIGVTADEQATAVHRFSVLSKRFDLAHLQDRHPDGVKGVTIVSPPEMPFSTGTLKDPRLDALRRWACNAYVFGEYELVGQKAFIGKDGRGIFSKLRFNMIKDWRAGGEVAPVANIIVQGGEVTWRNERIRFENSASPFKLNTRYVLILQSKPTEQDPVAYANPYFMEVDNGTIYAGTGWTPFPTGTSLSEARKDIAKALAMKGCK